MTMPNAEQFLMGGSVSAKFEHIGASASGSIVELEVQQQKDYDDGSPLFWADGSPRWQLKVVLATAQRDPADPSDDGHRAIYIKNQMQQVVKAAVKQAGAPALAVGGTLTVTYTADGEQKDRKKKAPKVYSATYVPPNPLDQIAPPTTAPAPAAQPVPQPAPAPAPTPGVDMTALLAQMQQAQAPAAPPMPACPPGVDPNTWPGMWQAMTPEQQATLRAALGQIG